LTDEFWRATAYLDWDANADEAGVIGFDGDRAILAEMEGPGVIWRIWAALPGNGRLLFLLDGEEKPVLELPFFDLFDGQHPPFDRESLVYSASGGRNAYVPIPFQESCRILAEPGWGAYFHFTYSTFPEGTIVPTFTPDLPPDAVEALDLVDDFLSHDLGSDPAGERAGQEIVTLNLGVGPGQTETVVELQGEGSITSLHVVMDPDMSAGVQVDALRELVLVVSWDGEDEPSVWAPLGDFFGSAPGFAEYRSLPMGMTGEGFYSYWYMPFGDGALVEVMNEGTTARSLTFEVTHAPLALPVEKLGRFHAKWHRNAFLPDEPGREIDWTMLTTQGSGRFVGTVLHVWNPEGGWWGEGDEKFFVDGEKFPSTFGTGSEDYFGYAWCNHELFSRPFHNQTVGPPMNPCLSPGPEQSGGHTSNNRWHVADNVPFQDSFEASIEKYFDDSRGTLYANTVFWYLEPGGEDPYGFIPLEERLEYFQSPNDTGTAVP